MISEVGDYRLKFFNGATSEYEFLYLPSGTTQETGVSKINYFLDVNGSNQIYFSALEVYSVNDVWNIV